MVRVEVRVTKVDAPLVRAIAAALTSPARQSETRALLREHFGGEPTGFKAFLEGAPMERIHLTRSRDRGRRVSL